MAASRMRAAGLAMGLVDDFERVLAVCEGLEQCSIPPRLKRRIANAYARATEKALVLAWNDAGGSITANATLFRHAERGARDYIP